MMYQEAMEYIHQLEKRGSVPGLDTIKELLKRLGNPQNEIKVIHVAGTNGKGSICAFLDEILEDAGYVVGRYISPTVFTYLERFQINKKYMDKRDFSRILERVREICQDMEDGGYGFPTAFEVETAVAFCYFQEMNVDFLLLEVGMGGLLDATNVVERPVCDVIGSISLDHTAFLGDTIEEIFKQKLGIMREGVPVVTYPLQRSLRGIWIEKCDAFRCLDESVEVDESQITLKNTELTGSSYIYKGEQYQLSVPGEYQVYNSAVAVETAKLLKKMGHGLKKVNIARGIKNTVWEGRFQVVDTQPLTIVDGAHNPGGWRALRDSIETYLSDRDIIYVCGVFKDKDYLYMLNRMLPGAKEFIALTPPGPRGLSAEVLADKAKEYIGSTYVSESGAQAMDLAKKLSQKYDNPAIVVFGSLSFIGPIIELEEACHRGDREMEREVKTRCDSSRKRADKATCDGSMERGDKARCDGSRKRADKVRCDGSMERADKVRCDSEYKALMNSIEMKEQERVFCRHGMSHVLDVARIAYILCLEEKLNLKKDVVYATALLHDIGRADVESTGKGHHIKSAEKAAEILARCDFESEEIDEICHAIERHNTDGDSHKGLSYALYKADKLSRNCYDCKAWDECYWNEDKKNKNLLI